MKYNLDPLGIIREYYTLPLENPIEQDPGRPITESAIADVKLKDVRAAYPLISALNSGRRTRNDTLYPRETLIGKKRPIDATGYASFVMPYPKPMIREHRLSDGFFGQGEAPLGRIIWAGYKKRTDKEGVNTPDKEAPAATMEGDGKLVVVPIITEQEAIAKVLGGAYHTVSVGSMVKKIIESISGADLVSLRRQGKDMPPFERGSTYDVEGSRKLSYWTMYDMEARELSYVNVPSDVFANTEDADIGEEGIRMLMGEKKPGKSNEFAFFDPTTGENLTELLSLEHFAFTPDFTLEDSIRVGENTHFIKPIPKDVTTANESVAPAVVPATTEPAKEEKPEQKKDDEALVVRVGDVISAKEHVGEVLRLLPGKVVMRVYEESKPRRYSSTLRIMTVNLEDVNPVSWTKRLIAPKPEKTEQYSPAEQEAKKISSKAVKSSELPKLKEFFLEYCKLDSSTLKELNSKWADPLSVLLTTQEWSLKDYVWAKRFQHVAENEESEDVRRNWGLTDPPVPPTTESVIEKTIREVLNG